MLFAEESEELRDKTASEILESIREGYNQQE
jgi:hypothetical protein